MSRGTASSAVQGGVGAFWREKVAQRAADAAHRRRRAARSARRPDADRRSEPKVVRARPRGRIALDRSRARGPC